MNVSARPNNINEYICPFEAEKDKASGKEVDATNGFVVVAINIGSIAASKFDSIRNRNAPP